MKRTCRYLLLIIGGVLLGLTFSSPLPPYTSRSLQHGWQLGHILLFIVWIYLLYPYIWHRFSRPFLRFITVIVITLVFGLLIETIQTFIGREFSFRDLAFDLIGGLLVLCFLTYRGSLNMRNWHSNVMYGLTLLSGIYALSPVALAVVDEVNMRSNFPQLADFDSNLELGRWHGNIEIIRLQSARGDEKVLKIALGTSKYSGVSLAYFPRDWRQYRYLQFELFNPDDLHLSLTIRIHDDKHYSLGHGDYYDRFNHSLHINPGWNSIELELTDIARAPRSRALDLSKVQALGLFSTELPEARLIYIDKMRLTK